MLEQMADNIFQAEGIRMPQPGRTRHIDLSNQNFTSPNINVTLSDKPKEANPIIIENIPLNSSNKIESSLYTESNSIINNMTELINDSNTIDLNKLKIKDKINHQLNDPNHVK